MGAMAYQITSLTIVYSTVYSGADQRKKIKAPRHLPLCEEFTVTSEFPAQIASNAENVSIWWRNHVYSVALFLSSLALCVLAPHFVPTRSRYILQTKFWMLVISMII